MISGKKSKLALLKRVITDLWQKHRQIMLYGVIGLSALGLEVAIFYFLVRQPALGVAVANLIAMAAGLVFSFSLNARLNFRVRDQLTRRFGRYAIVTIGGFLLSTAIVLALVWIFTMPATTAKLISLPAFFIFQYTCHRLYAFRDVLLMPQPEPVSE